MYPKISLIVPCYNVEKYLPTCFESIKNQTFRDFEVIFVNDASTDNTGIMIQEFIHGKQFAKYYEHSVNKGIGETRNTGLKHSNGEFVAFCDPDDVLHPQFLEILYKTICEHNADMVICKFKRVWINKRNRIKNGNISEKNDVINGTEKVLNAFFALDEYLSWSVWNKIYRNNIIKENKISFGSLRWAEDVYFNTLYILHSKKAVLNYTELYYYIQHKDSLVHRSFSKERLYIYKHMINILRSNYSESLEKNIKAYFTIITQDTLNRAILLGYKNKADLNKLIKMLSLDLKYLRKKHMPLRITVWIPLCYLYYKVRVFFMRDNGEELSEELNFDYTII